MGETMIIQRDNEYFSKHYKLIATDLSKPFELENPHLRKH